MKITKIIVLILLISKASFGMGLGSITSSSCCSDKTEIECSTTDNGESEDNRCCNGNICDCLCCGHVFLDFGLSQKEIQAPITPYFPVFTFYNSYNSLDYSDIWQPPKLFQ